MQSILAYTAWMKTKKYMYNNVILLNPVYNFVLLKTSHETCIKNIKDVIKSGVLLVYLIITGIFLNLNRCFRAEKATLVRQCAFKMKS